MIPQVYSLEEGIKYVRDKEVKEELEWQYKLLMEKHSKMVDNYDNLCAELENISYKLEETEEKLSNKEDIIEDIDAVLFDVDRPQISREQATDILNKICEILGGRTVFEVE